MDARQEASVEQGGAPLAGEPKLTVRVLRRCNFCCPSCSTFSGPEGRGVLALPDFCRAMDLLASADYHGIINISGGEPTLHPELTALLKHAAEALPRVRIAVFTHGHWVGDAGWQRRLQALLDAGPNVLLRFSLDRQHAVGIARSLFGNAAAAENISTLERQRLDKARRFDEACRRLGAEPGRRYDFAFKGSLQQGRDYTASIGQVPLYLITFRSRPRERPELPGFFALDVDEENRPLVFLTLGHLAKEQPMGGLERLLEALAINRQGIK